MNRKYYIVLPYQRKGPYNIEELKKQKITKDTLIWTFELNEPIKAGDLTELNSIWQELENNPINEDVPPPPPDLTEPPVMEEIPSEQPDEAPERNEENTPLFDNNDLPKFDDEDTPPPIFNNDDTPGENFNPPPSQEPEKIITPPPIPNEPTNKNEPPTPPPPIQDKPIELENPQSSPPPPIITQPSSQSNFSYQETTFKNSVPPKPKDYIIWSILTAIFCCNVFSIASFITGIQCKNKYIAGQYEEAKKLSKTTLIILIIGTVITALFWIAAFAEK